MAKKRIAINGFGRIGRLVCRNLYGQKNIEIVAINDLTDNLTLAHLLKNDSAQGTFEANVSADDEYIKINRTKVLSLSERDPAKLPWKKLKIDIVLECTGRFTTEDQLKLHIKAGAKKVILSAPPKSKNVKLVVLGVNEKELTGKEKLISNASCTTNCLAPVVKILNENWGIVQGTMTTTHAFTADQRLQDAPHKDLRRARAASVNIIPTSTGAASALSKVYPQIHGKLMALALRVPVIAGSLIDLTVQLEKEVSSKKINDTFKKYAKGPLKGILQYSESELVSSDIIGNTHASIFDSKLTKKSGNWVRVVSWYDNEAGYAARLADLVMLVK